MADGALGDPYSFILQADGGIRPYSWSRINGTWPSGLSLNSSTGTIYGTPTTRQSSEFTVRVVDSDAPAQSAEHTYTMQANQLPNAPSNPFPSDSAANVAIAADLAWSANDPDGQDTLRYDVYFGTTAVPPIVASNHSAGSYDPGVLLSNTVYYWKIVVRDMHGAETPGPVWSFTTLNRSPQQPSAPIPADGATDVAVDTDLSWTGGDPDPGDSVVYDVYFGTLANPPLVSTDQSQSYYSPGGIEANTTYYWKIAARDDHGGQTAGPVWQITTAQRPVTDFSAEPTTGRAPLIVDFFDESEGPASSWQWNCGDGTSSNEQDPTHTYTDPGVYTVTLTVAGPGGSDTETKTDYIVVEERSQEAMPWIPLLLLDE